MQVHTWYNDWDSNIKSIKLNFPLINSCIHWNKKKFLFPFCLGLIMTQLFTSPTKLSLRMLNLESWSNIAHKWLHLVEHEICEQAASQWVGWSFSIVAWVTCNESLFHSILTLDFTITWRVPIQYFRSSTNILLTIQLWQWILHKLRFPTNSPAEGVLRSHNLNKRQPVHLNFFWCQYHPVQTLYISICGHQIKLLTNQTYDNNLQWSISNQPEQAFQGVCWWR